MTTIHPTGQAGGFSFFHKDLVSFSNVSFSYNKKSIVLDELSFNIARGNIVAILGHNGAGKTTILRLLGNLIHQESGTITWNMLSNERISLMPEGLGLYPRLSGYENMQLRLLSANIKINEQTIMYLLRKIKMEKYAKEKVGHYSTGMKKRLSLACSLITNPDLLLLDEPFSGIDPVSQKIMVDSILENRRIQSSTVMAIHDLHVVKELCDSFIIIQGGKVVYYSENDVENIENIYFKFAGNS
ncbi:ABC transporter ATP-binding protein [Pillotina sp. SPG140]|jgi:ABC-2 type transport system ATP-binding protein